MSNEFWRVPIVTQVKVVLKDFETFALLTGDNASHHLDSGVAQKMGYKSAICQGLLVLSLSGKASSEYLRSIAHNGVTYGYDKLRFPSPVYDGENLTITYTPFEINEKNIISSQITVKTSNGDVAVAGNHLLKIFENSNIRLTT